MGGDCGGGNSQIKGEVYRHLKVQINLNLLKVKLQHRKVPQAHEESPLIVYYSQY
jgi:hypothetical protein